MPFHSSSFSLMPWLTMSWKSLMPAASTRLRSASCFSRCSTYSMRCASCCACSLASMACFSVSGSCRSRSRRFSTITQRGAEGRDQQDVRVRRSHLLIDGCRPHGIEVIEDRGFEPHDQAFFRRDGSLLLDLLGLDAQFRHA